MRTAFFNQIEPKSDAGTQHICRSLGIDSVEANHRFGSPA